MEAQNFDVVKGPHVWVSGSYAVRFVYCLVLVKWKWECFFRRCMEFLQWSLDFDSANQWRVITSNASKEAKVDFVLFSFFFLLFSFFLFIFVFKLCLW